LYVNKESFSEPEEGKSLCRVYITTSIPQALLIRDTTGQPNTTIKQHTSWEAFGVGWAADGY